MSSNNDEDQNANMRLYLDTTIVNDIWVIFQADSLGSLRRRDIKKPRGKWIYEYVALYYLLDLSDQWDLEFGSSPVMFEEISKMTAKNAIEKDEKNFLLDTYRLLKQKIIPYEPKQVPEHLYNQVSLIITSRNDILHICQSFAGGWDYFITTDSRSVLKHANELRPLGINAASPKRVIEENFVTLEELVRTLHGSWTSLNDIVLGWSKAIREANKRLK